MFNIKVVEIIIKKPNKLISYVCIVAKSLRKNLEYW